MRCRLLLLLAFIMAPVVGCVAVAYPPAPPADPVEVFLLKQGAHTGVVLPVIEGKDAGWVEYAFGNWGWYGEGNQNTVYGVYALAVPNRSALGRRFATVHPQQDALLSERGASLQGFAAERALVAALQVELDEEFSAAGVQPREAGLSGLLVVPARQDYALNYNCSDATIQWMRRLGCSVPVGGIVRSIELRQTGP